MTSKLPAANIKALYFDVFGTTVDWRSTVTVELHEQASKALEQGSSNIPKQVKENASKLAKTDWGRFAQEWRNSYYAFTHAVAKDSSTPYKTIDEHNLDSLKGLLKGWDLEDLWTPEEVQEISRVWHRLNPWPDTCDGIRALNKRFSTCTLSNGNVGLLEDMARHAQLEWTHILSAEMFGTYKPNAKVYLGAAEKLGLTPTQCCMVAAHLGDLKAAKSHGFTVVYVERPEEETWSKKDVEQAEKDGWVDLWIGLEENGFLTAAKMLGIELRVT